MDKIEESRKDTAHLVVHAEEAHIAENKGVELEEGLEEAVQAIEQTNPDSAY
jgi:hypothetical protein